MATTLAANISATDKTLTVANGAGAMIGARYRIGDEIVEFRGYLREFLPSGRGDIDPDQWAVLRGVDSVAVSHLSGVQVIAVADAFATGTLLTPPSPFDGVSQQTVLRVIKTLTQADILSMRGTPAEILPATEILDYSGSPTQMPVPVWGFYQFNRPASTAYSNVPNPMTLILAWGSDWSLSAAHLQVAATSHFASPLPPSVQPHFVTTDAKPDHFGVFAGATGDAISGFKNNIKDNGLYLTYAGDGSGGDTAGELAGGNAGNTITVTVAYVLVDFV